MDRVVYGKELEKFWVMDVREYTSGRYAVEHCKDGGVEGVYLSRSLGKCIAKAKELNAKLEP